MCVAKLTRIQRGMHRDATIFDYILDTKRVAFVSGCSRCLRPSPTAVDVLNGPTP